MEPVDLAKLETAIKYVERIAEGNNPVNNLPMEEDAVLNNPNVIRCMYFVRGGKGNHAAYRERKGAWHLHRGTQRAGQYLSGSDL